MDAGKAPPAFTAPIRKPANFGSSVGLLRRSDVQCAANAHDARGRRRAEMDTAGASRLAEVCKHQTSSYSDRRFAADVVSTAIKPSLVRHSRATVDPDRGRLSAPQQRFTINREPVDLQVNQAGLTPQKLASNPGSGTCETPATRGGFLRQRAVRESWHEVRSGCSRISRSASAGRLARLMSPGSPWDSAPLAI